MPQSVRLLNKLMTVGQSLLIKQALVDITRRSILANVILTSALFATSEINTVFAAGTLSSQLKFVALMIVARDTLGMKRQMFFVGLGGFDVHNELLIDHPPLLSEINDALGAFYAATEELQVVDKITTFTTFTTFTTVTTFTTSDFGRTLNSNGDGIDHG